MSGLNSLLSKIRFPANLNSLKSRAMPNSTNGRFILAAILLLIVLFILYIFFFRFEGNQIMNIKKNRAESMVNGYF